MMLARNPSSSRFHAGCAYSRTHCRPAQPARRANVLVAASREEASEQFRAKWYNAMTTGLLADKQNFQLYDVWPTLLPATADNASVNRANSELWSQYGKIPDKSLYAAENLKSFYDGYASLLYSLVPPTGEDDTALQAVLGEDLFNGWKEALKQPGAGKSRLERFKLWADENLPSEQRYRKALALFKGDLVFRAQDQFDNATVAGLQLDPVTKKGSYSLTIQEVNTLVNQGSYRTVNFNTSTTSADVSETWAKVEISGFWDLFSGGASATYDKINEKISTSSVAATITFTNVSRITMTPTGWFDSALLAYAYYHKETEAWEKSRSWDEFFGNTGQLQRSVLSLYVAKGATVTMTIKADLSDTEKEAVKAAANAGFWPFVSASGSGGSSSEATFKSDGSLVITSTAKPEALTIIGREVGLMGRATVF